MYINFLSWSSDNLYMSLTIQITALFTGLLYDFDKEIRDLQDSLDKLPNGGRTYRYLSSELIE